MDAFLAGITTIPYFKAIMIDGDYYIEGGYLDNTPLASIFQDPEVDEIIACDFTDYDYHAELDKIYRSSIFTLPFTSIDTHLLVSDIQLTLPNRRIFAQAEVINRMLERMGKVVGRDRWPYVLAQTGPCAAAEELGEHDDLVEGCDRAEALL